MPRTALITGGARGIGLGIAQNLSRDHDVAITWHTTPPDDLPKGVLAIQADLTKKGSPVRVVQDVTDRFGGLDVIVNNAGLVASTPKGDIDMQAARAVLDVNLLAPAALPVLKAGAAVVNISSVNAVLPPRDASIYGASKAALDLWTKAMAKELGPSGIRVNAVAPGAINIPDAMRPKDLQDLFLELTALDRLGVPEDIARAVRFLASDEASFITGETLTVSGGYRL
jgi:3-oxoacyl-[acyl-carrier protein] reductase